MKKILMMILMGVFGIGFVLSDFCVYAAENAEDEFTLEEITVTAQKRVENQQKVPIAMEVISGDTIKETGKNDIDEILSNISSVLIQSNTDGIRVSIRGVSNDNTPFEGFSAYSPSVAVNQDGVYTNRNQGNQNMYDIERVEVLYGPQSTIYATASPGGIVNVISAAPKLEVFEGAGTIEYGNYNLIHTEGSMNAPLGEKLALRAAFSQSSHDGYLTNGSMDEDTKSARLKALFKPSDKLSFILTEELTKTGGQGMAGVKAFDKQDGYWYTGTSSGPGQPQILVKDAKVTDPWTSASDSAGAGQDLNTKKTTARMDWDMGNVGTLSIIGAYLKTDSSNESTTVSSDVTYDQTSRTSGYEKDIEVRITSSEDFPFKWIVGGNLYRSRDTLHSYQEAVDLATDWQYEYAYSLDNMNTIYGNITYPVTSRFRATAGIRKNDHEVGVWRDLETPSQVDKRGDLLTYDKPNYKLGVEYDLADNSMLFADWSTSYRMNAAMSVGSPMEELAAYTAGAKNRFLNNKLQVNVSTYYYDYRNYFANGPRFDPPYDSDGDGILDSTYEVDGKRFGDAVIYGADLQTSMIITTQDKLDLSVSFVKKYFTDLYFDWPQIVNDCGIPDLNYSGKDMPQAPNWNVASNYSHSFFFADGSSLKAGIDIRYTSKTCLNWQAETLAISFAQDADGNYTGGYTSTVLDTGPVRYQEAYYIENINLVYTDPSGKFTLSGYVNNLTNYAVKRFLDGQNNMMIGNPRTFGAVLSVKF